jgi:hypothetical protein
LFIHLALPCKHFTPVKIAPRRPQLTKKKYTIEFRPYSDFIYELILIG